MKEQWNQKGRDMFKHLLVPIDGSYVTKKSLKNVLDLAKKDKASTT
jgi:nucleotide-binding universal stress UspA family protein